MSKRPRSKSPPRTPDDGPLPVIDIGPFLAADAGVGSGALPAEAAEVVRQWRAAFAEFGFAQVVGHGVPNEVLETAYNAAERFFALPAAEKSTADLGRGYGAGGFTAQGVERVSATASRPDGSQLLGAAQARPPDRVENMLVHGRPSDVIPAGVEGYEAAVHGYFDEMVRVLRGLMRLTAAALDLPLDYFDPHFFADDGALVGECTLRLAHYPAYKDGEEPLPGQLRYGEHTDYTGYTILWQDHNAEGPQTASDGARPPLGGLQVRLPGGGWADVPPLPGAFVVNSGDLIQVWTNDVLLSNLHRVTNPPPGDRDDRISLVFFTGPAEASVLECLPTCQGPERPPRYAPVTAGEHLRRKLTASNR